MRALVVGGAGSGKSAFAESLACSLSATRTYLATMEQSSTEARERIRKHRLQRQGLGFKTIECARELPTSPWSNRDPRNPEGVALLDDLGNLVANALFRPDGSMANATNTLEHLHGQIRALSKGWEHVVVVGNEAGAEPSPSSEATRAWVWLQGALCCAVAADFDTVVEVVAGVPQIVKGELP